jgi:phage tail-like protein
MSRGTAPDLPVTRPIIRELPSIYQDGMFLERFTAGLDAVLAPAVASIDCLHAYIDPTVAPGDFVAWMGGWVGARFEEDWTLERRREFVADAVRIFAMRGTVRGLTEELELYSGGRVAISDPGAVWTSPTPTGDDARAERRSEDRTVRVVVDVPDSTTVNWAALRVMVRDAVPAHLPVEIELREVDSDGGQP